MASKGDPCCAALVGLVIGLGLLYYGLQRYLLLQKINNTPTSKVRSAAVGLVELFGNALCKEPQSSPISQAKCIYWKVHEEWYQPGKHGGWRTISLNSSHKDFYLQDETGKMLVDPSDATIEIPSDFSSTGRLSGKGFLGIPQKQLDQKVLDYLERNPEAKARCLRYSSYELRFTEWFIAEGDPLYVLGTAEPQDGVSSSIGFENLVMKQGKYDKMFYISDSGERKVTDNIKGSMYWAMGIGFVLSAICAYYILYRMTGGT
jgi:hypothetical protein